MNQDLSIISLVMGASWVVQLVIAGLLLVSLASWSVIFSKLVGLARVRGRNDQFEQVLVRQNLGDLYQSANSRVDAAPMEQLFASGMRVPEAARAPARHGRPARRRTARCAPACNALDAIEATSASSAPSAR
jgi:biopolymer transport protein ExbB/TolQ